MSHCVIYLGGKSHGLLKISCILCCLDWGFCRCLFNPFDFWCNLKTIFIIFIYFMCTCVCVVHSIPHVRRSEDNLQELFLFIMWTQEIELWWATLPRKYFTHWASWPVCQIKKNTKTLELNDLHLLVRAGYWNTHYCSIGINLWLHIKKYLFYEIGYSDVFVVCS